MVFGCFEQEQARHLSSFEEMVDLELGEETPLKRAELPAPLQSTNLDRITCEECWREIKLLAPRRLAGWRIWRAALEGADPLGTERRKLEAEVERLRSQALSMTVYAQGQEARIDAALEEADAALEMFEERSGLEEVVKALKGEA